MRISLIIPTRNEEPDRLRRTIASLRPHVDEVIVVDDGGERVVEPGGMPDGVRLWRNPESLGCSSARNVGAAMATGDVLLTADSHVTVASGDLRGMCLVAADRQAIIQPATVADDWPANPWCTWGDQMMPYPCGAVVGRFDAPADAYAPSSGLYGSVYAIPRRVWDRLGHGVYSLAWGCAEEGLALAAGFCQVPILVSRDVRCTHTFNNSGRFPYVVPADWWKLNWWLLHHRWAERDYWQYYWRPLLEAQFGDLIERGRTLTDSREALHRWSLSQPLKRVADDVFWDAGRRLRPLSPSAAKRVEPAPASVAFFAARPWLLPVSGAAAARSVAVPVAVAPSILPTAQPLVWC